MDPDAKLFYRKSMLDYGPGRGFREGQRQYEEEYEKRRRITRNLISQILENEAMMHRIF